MIWLGASSFLLVLTPVQDGFSHAGVLGFTLALTHIDTGNHFFPTFSTHLSCLFLFLKLLRNIRLFAPCRLFFLTGLEFLQLLPALFFPALLPLPFFFLHADIITLFSLRSVWIRSSSYRIRRAVSSSSNSLNSLSGSFGSGTGYGAS